MRLYRIGLLAVALLLFCTSYSMAVEVTVSPMVGGYVFDNDLLLKDSPVYSLGLGLNFDEHWSVEGTAEYSKAKVTGSSNGNKLNYYSGRLGLLYHFKPIRKWTPYFLGSVGVLRLEGNDDGQFTYGVGTKLSITDNIALRVEARHVVGIETNKDYDYDGTFNNFAFSAGLLFTFGQLQAAPTEYMAQAEEPAPVEKSAVVKEEPVPVKPAEDSDNDGVIDVLDRCPVTPNGTPVDAEGCPKTIKFIDSDGDGVSDVLDACPETADGVGVDMRGCPLPDSDADGVLDVDDKCAGTDPQVKVDEFGCPRQPDKQKIAGLVIEYSTSQTALSAEAIKELKLLATKVKDTERGQLLVEGHTDSVGSAAYNMKLSQQRADKVRQTLISDFGVDPTKVVAKGYGPYEPVASNGTQKGRQQNRRVVVRFNP